MKRILKALVIAALAIPMTSLPAAAQTAPAAAPARPSPKETAEQTFGGKKLSITYGAPSARGRKIMGELVPYGKVWRTGANEATTLVTPVDLMIGKTHVPAGTYTLYTLPSASGWKLIINKQTGQWGTVYDEKQDLAREDMKVEKTSAPVEKMVIKIEKKDDSNGAIALEWENTRVSVPIMIHGK